MRGNKKRETTMAVIDHIVNDVGHLSEEVVELEESSSVHCVVVLQNVLVLRKERVFVPREGGMEKRDGGKKNVLED